MVGGASASRAASPTVSSAFGQLTSAEELGSWRALFDAHHGRTGSVSKQSLGLMLRALGEVFTNAELSDLVTFADINRTRQISFEEFTALMLHRQRRSQLEQHGHLGRSSSRILRLIAQLRAGEPDVVLEAAGALLPSSPSSAGGSPSPAGRDATAEASTVAAADDGEASGTAEAAAHAGSRAASPELAMHGGGSLDGSSLEQERWQLLCVADELWCNRTAVSLDLSRVGPALAGVGLSELCRAIACSPTLQLRELDLSGVPLGDAGAAAVAAMLSGTSHLHVLRLEHCAISTAGAAALLGALEASNRSLQRLLLAGNGALKGSPLLGQLREQLRDNAARSALAQVPTHLPRLMLAGRGLAPRHMAHVREALVARLPRPPTAEERKLEEQAAAQRKRQQQPPKGRIDAFTGKVVQQQPAQRPVQRAQQPQQPPPPPRAPLVRKLDLSLNAASGDALAALLVCKGGAHVDELVLTWAAQHAAQAPRLATALRAADAPLAASVAQLQTLTLTHTGLTDEGAAALAAALHSRCLPALTELDLRHNALGSTAFSPPDDPLAPVTAPARHLAGDGGRSVDALLPSQAHAAREAASRSVAAALGYAIAVQVHTRALDRLPVLACPSSHSPPRTPPPRLPRPRLPLLACYPRTTRSLSVASAGRPEAAPRRQPALL